MSAMRVGNERETRSYRAYNAIIFLTRSYCAHVAHVALITMQRTHIVTILR